MAREDALWLSSVIRLAYAVLDVGTKNTIKLLF